MSAKSLKVGGWILGVAALLLVGYWAGGADAFTRLAIAFVLSLVIFTVIAMVRLRRTRGSRDRDRL